MKNNIFSVVTSTVWLLLAAWFAPQAYASDSSESETELVHKIFRLKYVKASEIAKFIAPILSADGSMVFDLQRSYLDEDSKGGVINQINADAAAVDDM